VKPRNGPLWVFGSEERQMRVGRPKQRIVHIELREDAKAGEELVLTDRDVAIMQTMLQVPSTIKEP